MDSTSEIKASISTGEEHVRDAEHAFADGRYHDCAYHSAAAAENAGNALILALGGRVPRTHRNAEAIEFVTKRLKPEWLKDGEFRKMMESLGDLEIHVVKSRYPIKIKKGNFVAPKEYYTKETAKNMLEKAIFVLTTVKRFLAAT
ncbi:MAG: HEPN domain-containing protein [Thermoproteota archaeon]|nr:HEPN domain-containing protein [Thermoproteota archaeon]